MLHDFRGKIKRSLAASLSISGNVQLQHPATRLWEAHATGRGLAQESNLRSTTSHTSHLGHLAKSTFQMIPAPATLWEQKRERPQWEPPSWVQSTHRTIAYYIARHNQMMNTKNRTEKKRKEKKEKKRKEKGKGRKEKRNLKLRNILFDPWQHGKLDWNLQPMWVFLDWV